MKIKVDSQATKMKYESPLEVYLRESNKGNDISLLMESKSPDQKYERKSIIVPRPAIKIEGKKSDFQIIALTKGGEELLKFFGKQDFSYAKNYLQNKKSISGKVVFKENPSLSEEDSFKLANISFVIKTILSKFESSNTYAGLYGAYAYDFAKNFYRVKEKHKDEATADFELFLPTEVFVLYDNEKRAEKITFSFNEKKYKNEKAARGFSFVKQESKTSHDIEEREFLGNIQKVIKDIHNGRAMQCVLSRRTTTALQRHPIDSYAELREKNPAPYSFYYNFGENEILYGASPEMHIKIDKTLEGKEIQMRLVAGTIVRSKNPLEDAQARRKLLTDEKELREHTMLVDLARHEIYKLSKTKTVEVTDLFTLETYPNLYHLVSGVRGVLRQDKDAIDSLLVTIPLGTLSGAPKLEAMKMVEEYEGSKRGFFGGASGLVSFNGECNTGTTIRSVYVKGSKAEIRGGAGITALSTPERELKEINLKISNAISVLGEKK